MEIKSNNTCISRSEIISSSHLKTDHEGTYMCEAERVDGAGTQIKYLSLFVKGKFRL